ncbi:DUF2207 domain-containing protein [Micromonospora sp. CPCC 205371]|nr:DUF2207 domain-containing protein [Micromonospora sp. CPCC 205371]
MDIRWGLAVLIGFVAVVVALGLLVRLVAWSTAARVPAGRATPDLIDTPPAVVNLLMNGLRAAPEAAAATLLDLAARGHLELYQPAADPGETVVRVRRGAHAGLTSYEQRVLDRVDVAPGVHPLTLADLARRQAQDGQTWQERLVVATREDAIARGLMRVGATPPAMVVLVVGLMLLVVLSCVPGVFVVDLAGMTERLGDTGVAVAVLGIAFVLMLLAIFAVVGLGGELRDDRLTAEGRRVARHWSGVARWLNGHEAFADLPPASVTVWDSYIPYGVALGVATRATATVDLRVGRVDVIRSPLGDRLVRIRYPATGGLKATSAGVRVLSGLIGIALVAAIVTRDLPDWAAPVAITVGALLTLRWAYRIVRGLADLVGPASVSGRVVRIVPFGTFGDAETTKRLTKLFHGPPLSWLTRRVGAPTVTSDGTGLSPGFFVVLDDGTSPVLQAWLATPRSASRLRPGDDVTARVQRWTKRLTGTRDVDAHPTDNSQAAARH